MINLFQLDVLYRWGVAHAFAEEEEETRLKNQTNGRQRRVDNAEELQPIVLSTTFDFHQFRPVRKETNTCWFTLFNYWLIFPRKKLLDTCHNENCKNQNPNGIFDCSIFLVEMLMNQGQVPIETG